MTVVTLRYPPDLTKIPGCPLAPEYEVVEKYASSELQVALAQKPCSSDTRHILGLTECIDHILV